MGDTSSACIFGTIFCRLADIADGKLTVEEAVKRFYQDSWEYDFANYELDCDEILIKFGLAKVAATPDGDEETVYMKRDLKTWDT